MIRDVNSSRSKKWIFRNNLNNNLCKEYVDNLCSVQFNFNIYNFSMFNNDLSLYITYNTNSYVVYINKNIVGLDLIEITNDKYHYKHLKYFYGDSCWYDCFNYIKNIY